MSHLILPAPLPKPWVLCNEEFGGSSNSITLAANGVYLYLTELLSPVSVSVMRYRMAATAAGTVDLGIYDANGNLMGHTGAQNTVASNMNSLNLLTSNLFLPAGRYMIAMCPSNATDTYVGGTTLKLGGGRYAIATNTGTAGVLPATTGTLLTTTFSLAVLAVVIGGAP